MKTSPQGVRFLAKEEALVLCAYPDGEHMSIGFGRNDPALKPGDTITIEQALEYLAADLVPRERAIEKMLKVPVTQNEFDPLVSAYYNKGNLIVPVIAAINAGHKDEAMAAFLTINRNKAGVFKPGLALRRVREMDVFRNGNYGDLSKIKIWRGDPNKTKPEEIPFPENPT